MLSFRLHTRIGEQDLLLPHEGPHRLSPPLPVKAGWRGGSPSLDATGCITDATHGSNARAGQIIAFLSRLLSKKRGTATSAPALRRVVCIRHAAELRVRAGNRW
jgi:hypothetical protein